MDNLLSKALDEHTPRMNDKFVRGIAKDDTDQYGES